MQAQALGGPFDGRKWNAPPAFPNVLSVRVETMIGGHQRHVYEFRSNAWRYIGSTPRDLVIEDFGDCEE